MMNSRQIGDYLFTPVAALVLTFGFYKLTEVVSSVTGRSVLVWPFVGFLFPAVILWFCFLLASRNTEKGCLKLRGDYVVFHKYPNLLPIHVMSGLVVNLTVACSLVEHRVGLLIATILMLACLLFGIFLYQKRRKEIEVKLSSIDELEVFSYKNSSYVRVKTREETYVVWELAWKREVGDQVLPCSM